MTDTGVVMTVAETPQVPTAKKKRGRETALDMVRSLAVVFLLVIPLWFFGQSSPDDSKKIRPVDPAGALRAFAVDTGGPVPSTPAGWTVNVRSYEDGVVRVGYVVGEHYLEFSGARGRTFLDAATGKAKPGSSVNVAGVTWREYRSADGHESLVHTVGNVTVLVGGIREDASLDELKMLAATVR